MINKLDIDNGFKYYNLNENYKYRCYECAEFINSNIEFSNSFDMIYNLLNYSEFSNIEEFWNIKNINNMFCENIDPFVTNLIVVLSYTNHQHNIKEYKLDDEQINIHKKRVKECFENDLINRNYDGIRISQMLWAIYFIRIVLIEVGRLQYELYYPNIKIHIPKGEKLIYGDVIESLNNSRKYIEKYFKLDRYDYYCNSWLLSSSLKELLDGQSNIMKFQSLFDIKDGESCIDDILNFVFNLKNETDFSRLDENTSLQRSIKNYLLQGNDIKLGMGILKI